MTFLNFLENLFTGFRPYNFVRRLRARPPKEKHLHSQNNSHKRFMSKHRYSHTTKKWDIGIHSSKQGIK